MYIGMNGKAHIHFSDGTKLKEVENATYLGGILSWNASRLDELNNRISKALTTCNKLKTFWYKTNCTYKWKLQVYNAIIVAQLTYGLNTLQLTPSLLAKLDAFQMRGLRYILKIEHSFYSHVTNEEVYKRANIALNRGRDLNITWEEIIAAGEFAEVKTVTKLSDYVMRQQGKLLGHLIRAPRDDLMRQPSLGENLVQNEQLYRRSGRPRPKWIDSNVDYMFRHLNQREIDRSRNDDIQLLQNQAIGRRF